MKLETWIAIGLAFFGYLFTWILNLFNARKLRALAERPTFSLDKISFNNTNNKGNIEMDNAKFESTSGYSVKFYNSAKSLLHYVNVYLEIDWKKGSLVDASFKTNFPSLIQFQIGDIFYKEQEDSFWIPTKLTFLLSKKDVKSKYQNNNKQGDKNILDENPIERLRKKPENFGAVGTATSLIIKATTNELEDIYFIYRLKMKTNNDTICDSGDVPSYFFENKTNELFKIKEKQYYTDEINNLLKSKKTTELSNERKIYKTFFSSGSSKIVGASANPVLVFSSDEKK
ncbi:hypothetical protein ACFIUX_07750 [Oenococcus oeni]|uniref:Uncharacterized protein n=2 Tax=root TaxID=1 RepID=V5UQT7_9CAUD|nr:hypothetical protein [Oenococcus oeni]YP_009006592.1 hypothetical protein CF81_gp10 [Oenococcus phage phiS11]AHB80351.1 hypothetical protein [Oenococcus phage phiS11]MDS0176477.1 hypothetical protein [Oenococcus oeni]OIM37083.1 hypothetical protein ATX68_12685 [Oenococcus oeni]OLQ42065.1 hypothetical protein ATX63_09530 [Oenococcus oeni]